MPVYEYLCPSGHHSETFRPMAESSVANVCPYCGLEAPRKPSLVRVFSDFEGYESPASGKWIEGKKARREDLARTHCRPYEDGERDQAVRRAAERDRLLVRQVEEGVERAAAELHLRS